MSRKRKLASVLETDDEQQYQNESRSKRLRTSATSSTNQISHDHLQTVLQSRFNLKSFRKIQRDTIETIINDQDVLLLMPTGGGKSLCYQLPILAKKKLGIVIQPLIALMANQVDYLNSIGVNARIFNSTLNLTQRQQLLSDLSQLTTSSSIDSNQSNSKIEMLYTTPETLATNAVLSTILTDLYSMDRISLIAIDECHCISTWGHDFRPKYRMLSKLRINYPKIPIIAVTATATDIVRKDIIASLNISPKIIIADFDRPNIEYRMRYIDLLKDTSVRQPRRRFERRKRGETRKKTKKSGVKNAQFVNVDPKQTKLSFSSISSTTATTSATTTASQPIDSNSANMKIAKRIRIIGDDISQFISEQYADSCGIIYVFRRSDAEEMALYLKTAKNIASIGAYHAGMPIRQRNKVQKWWQNGDVNILVSTNAFGMGIDKKNVRFIIHATITKCVEDYYQETGRAGRDGLPSVALCYYSQQDANMRERMAVNDHIDKIRKKNPQISKAAAKNEAMQLPRVKHLIGNIAKVKQMCENQTCLRRYILDYFGDNANRKSNPKCCEYCSNPQLSKDYSKVLSQKKSKSRRRHYDKFMGSTPSQHNFVPLSERTHHTRKEMKSMLASEWLNIDDSKIATKEAQQNMLASHSVVDDNAATANNNTISEMTEIAAVIRNPNASLNATFAAFEKAEKRWEKMQPTDDNTLISGAVHSNNTSTSSSMSTAIHRKKAAEVNRKKRINQSITASSSPLSIIDPKRTIDIIGLDIDSRQRLYHTLLTKFQTYHQKCTADIDLKLEKLSDKCEMVAKCLEYFVLCQSKKSDEYFQKSRMEIFELTKCIKNNRSWIDEGGTKLAMGKVWVSAHPNPIASPVSKKAIVTEEKESESEIESDSDSDDGQLLISQVNEKSS